MLYLCIEEMAGWNKKDNESTALYYWNGICFLSNGHFDHMVAVKHEAEESIGWEVLPEYVVYCEEKMSPI